MIRHPAMPCICNDMDCPEAAADEVFRSLVKWLEENNQPNRTLTGDQLYLRACDWQSLLKAVEK